MNKKSTVSFKRKGIKRMYRFKLDVSSFTTVNNLCIMLTQIIHTNIALLKQKQYDGKGQRGSVYCIFSPIV